jgi:hypothetical protein
MTLNLKVLIQQLEIADPEVVQLRDWVISSMGNERVMRSLLNKQCQNRNETHCYSCEEHGVCSVLTGIIHLDLGEYNTALKELEGGNQHFRRKDETWNSIIGRVMLGKAYEKYGNSHQAVLEYKKALHLLTENYMRVHANDYDALARARTLRNDLNSQVTQPFSPHLSDKKTVPLSRLDLNLPPESSDAPKAYLSLFSLPIYGNVTAGADGELHINPVENTFTIVNKIELNGKHYDLFSVGHPLVRDRQITLIPQESYGWAKVKGLSMNGWETPLEEHDYVLFRESPTANHNDFVVVSSRDPSGDLMYIIKRYDGSSRRLLSNSTDTSRAYDPIPITEDHKIFGVAIAVAKPLKNTIQVSKPVAEPVVKSISDSAEHLAEEKKLYNKLLTRALGDKEKIKRLMMEAYKKAPHENRLGLMRIVDEDWMADGNRG